MTEEQWEQERADLKRQLAAIYEDVRAWQTRKLAWSWSESQRVIGHVDQVLSEIFGTTDDQAR